MTSAPPTCCVRPPRASKNHKIAPRTHPRARRCTHPSTPFLTESICFLPAAALEGAREGGHSSQNVASHTNTRPRVHTNTRPGAWIHAPLTPSTRVYTHLVLLAWLHSHHTHHPDHTCTRKKHHLCTQTHPPRTMHTPFDLPSPPPVHAEFDARTHLVAAHTNSYVASPT